MSNQEFQRFVIHPSWLILAAAMFLPSQQVAAADRNDPATLDFFESRIRPVLVEHCQACHAGDEVNGGLRVDSRQSLREGGDSGPAVAPGKPDESLLLAALRHDGFEMPPSGRLGDGVVSDFTAWIEAGAIDPRVGGDVVAGTSGIDIEAGRGHWAFQPVARPDPPAVADISWPRNEIDFFILASLEAAGCEPAADAERLTWLRRVTFDLTGLPPTPAAMEAFLADNSSEAEAAVVEQLLASPRYGERMARHWLDVARFAESSGGGRSMVFKEAWRYRDYVINAFNADMPIDRFLTEQIAGDLLTAKTPADKARLLTATGYLLLGAINYEEQDKRHLEMDVVDEQLDTLGTGLLGMTLGCARCHDHKFDPIPTEDYYALAGIFRSTKTITHSNVSSWTERPLPMSPQLAQTVAAHDSAMQAIDARLETAKKQLSELTPENAPSGQLPSEALQPLAEIAEVKNAIEAIEEEKGQLENRRPVVPRAMAAAESGTIINCAVCIRGNVHNTGRVVPRGVVQVATVGEPPAMPADASGRRELAAWLADAEHPLTSRVFVNRIWQHLFGRGIVATPNNFGTTGSPPSHPELLDFLARTFTDGGWSTKDLVRAIVLSRTYRQACRSIAPARDDPNNTLLAGVLRRRLDAESLRDAILQVAGTLTTDLGGPGITDSKVLSKAGSDTPSEYTFRFTDTRRSIYTPAFRNRRLELFEVFDAANPNAVVGRRPVSTVAPQALYLLNSPFVMEQAAAAATRLLQMETESTELRIDYAFRTALGRAPSSSEHGAILAVVTRDGTDSQQAWTMVFQSLFGCIDFRTLE